MIVNLVINGAPASYDGDPDRPLLWYLREDLRLTGTKFGCGVGACGACTVLVNGAPARACLTPAASLEGATVMTIEGLNTPTAKAVQAAWSELDVVQCGWCQSGQIISATALLTKNPAPDASQIVDGMAGNVCRCATYQRIRAAVSRAAETLQAGR